MFYSLYWLLCFFCWCPRFTLGQNWWKKPHYEISTVVAGEGGLVIAIWSFESLSISSTGPLLASQSHESKPGLEASLLAPINTLQMVPQLNTAHLQYIWNKVHWSSFDLCYIGDMQQIHDENVNSDVFSLRTVTEAKRCLLTWLAETNSWHNPKYLRGCS